jgi:uncharacterized protein (TIGR02246 family)
MTHSTFSVAFLVLVGMVSCARQPSVDVAAERAALTEADSRYSQATSTKDADAFVGFYAQDGAMYPPEGSVVKGPDSIRDFVGPFFEDPGFAAKFTPLAVEVSQGGDMGYSFNLLELTATGPTGETVTEHLRDFHLWHKQADGSWKLVVDIWNAEPATQ